ncbi:MFS transporter [Nesterenkonia sp. CL21]|uniref:MFS transporter n=1 Tax=Nesterenkonia sp. CL21 TaxID=3064894 RepID=UPI0028798BEC|nr:MFS transporter [Nesterenkonia sp. CL21]MDS2172388.1 MFS transporter [Nesterenkonia sp. CL21]
MISTKVSARPTWREWTGLLLLALPLFMIGSDLTVMFLAMPAVTADLAPSTTQTLWIMHIGQFVSAGLVITMGWLTGRVGHKRLLLVVMALYGSASMLAAFAPNPETLLVARVLMGAAAAAATPAAISILRSMFTSAKHFGIAFAVVMGAVSVGGALGPPMGGLLLGYFWWGAVFLINVPVAALVLIAGLWIFPRTRETTRDRIDLISVALSMAAVLLVVFGLQEIADRGLSVPYVLAAVAGVGFGAWFIRRQRRIDNPLLDLSLFAIRALRICAIAFVISSAAFVAVDFVLVQYLQIVIGVPTTQLGLMLAIPGVAAIIGTALTPPLARRIAPSKLMAAGVCISLVGALLIITALLVTPHLTALLIAGTTIVAAGVIPLGLLGAQLIVTSPPKERAGSAVAIQDISGNMGAALGMAFIGSLAMAVYGRVLNVTAPAGVSDADLDAAAQSPGGAVAVAENLGGRAGQDLLTAAQEALSWGTVAAYIAAVVLGIATIVLILRGLKGIQLPSDAADEPAPEASASEVALGAPATTPESQPPITPAEMPINQELRRTQP